MLVYLVIEIMGEMDGEVKILCFRSVLVNLWYKYMKCSVYDFCLKYVIY